ncbi:MAG: hypothetical protein J5679_00115 [Alphaproteobacteria bacterium]|nr:hypothetical protein [Alphaproteobacteria bacterium]
MKYIIALVLLAIVILMPAYLARQSGQDKTNMARTRIASWLLGWTFIAWIWSLFRSTHK